MKFKLDTAGKFYNDLAQIELLKKYGFILNKYDSKEWIGTVKGPELIKTDYKPEIEITTLEDLEKISKDFSRPLIVDFEDKEIIIYDDYLE